MITIEQECWDLTPEGEAVIRYRMRNSHGSEVELTNLGAAVVAIRVPDRDDGTTTPGGDSDTDTDTDTDVPGKEDTDVPGGDTDGDDDGDGTPPGKTGDDFAMVGLIVLLVVGMAGAAAAVVLLKKNEAR